MNRIDIIQWFINFLGAKTYLEIGVRNGESFFPIQCRNKIGVDIDLTVLPSEGETLFNMSSDDFFRYYPLRFDVAFIDGDHTYKQSLRDVENCLNWMNPGGVIILHDCNPTQEEWATPEYIGASPNWCGEVWKTILTLRTDPSLSVHVFDTDFGVGVVMGGGQVSLSYYKGQVPLSYSRGQINLMTYKDLDKNRDAFLNLVKDTREI